jgi:DNA modification methylase
MSMGVDSGQEWPADRVERRRTAALVPYARNARTHSEAQVAQIAASVREWGWTVPVLVDEAGGIIAGHGRILAAQVLGLDEVPVMVAAGWTEAQKRAYVLADNRLALNAGWDTDLLKLEVGDLKESGFDLGLMGFGEDELAALLSNPTAGLTDEDAVPEAPTDPITVLGDVWLLGRHRVMCGDARMVDSMDRLMDGGRPDMVFTDPPYNINYEGVKDKRAKIKNDNLRDDEFVDFLTESLVGCETMYVCCSWQYAHLFRLAMQRMGRSPKAMIVWDKINRAQNLDKYFKQHEIIFYYGDFGGHKTVRGDVWSLKRQQNTLHPTMKPVELVEIALCDQPGKRVVQDSFGGSGSTLIACEKTGRDARVMEIEPRFCDVIVTRWQQFTGQQATLDGDGRTFEEVSCERQKTKAHAPAAA